MKYRKMLELVKALRSGKYLQTIGVLRGDGDRNGEHRYCCLGVACVLAGKRFDRHGQVSHEGGKEAGVMTPDVMAYFGFYSMSGAPSDGVALVVGGVRYAKLSVANDQGRSFKEIADAIRANWRRL